MDLLQWVAAEHASVATRFERSIAAVVPTGRWRDPAGAGGSSIAFLLYHTTVHADLAVNVVARGERPVLPAWRERLGTADMPDAAGVAEAEDTRLTAAFDLESLTAYADAVARSTADWLATLRGADLDRVPDAAAALVEVGIGPGDLPWLHSMWAGQPVSFFVQWEAIGHRINHLGEMVSVRNRLGLSPF